MTVWLAAAVLLGVAATGWWGPPPWWLTVLLAAVGALGVIRWPRRLAALILVGALALGLARGAHHLGSQTPLLTAAPGAEVAIEGTVLDDPPGARRTIQIERARLDGFAEAMPATGRVETFTHRALAPPGARVLVEGAFEPAPSRGRNRLEPHTEVFAGRVDMDEVRIVHDPGPSEVDWLTALRRHIDASIRDALPEPHASLLSAMLVGVRSGLPTALRDDFVRSGLIHIVAISGFNVTLIALAIRGLAGWAIGRYGVGVAMVLLPLYAVLAGGEPSVVRAAIMGELILLAWMLGRDADALTALALAAAGIVLVQPAALADVGFQLSFAGTVGLIVIAAPLARFLRGRLRIPTLGAEFLAVTLAASLMVTPLIAHTFGRLQLMSVPANLLALAAPPWIMVTGVPAALWAAAGWPGAETVAWAAWLPLEYLIRAAQLAAALPGASVPVEGYDLAHAAASYVCIALAIVLLGRARRRERLELAATRLPARALYVLTAIALVVPPTLAWSALPRFLDDGASYVTAEFGPGRPTVYVRHGSNDLVVVGSRMRRLTLDRALPRWDPPIDAALIPESGGRVAHTALAILEERPIERILASSQHALGPALVTPDRGRRTPITAGEKVAVDTLRADFVTESGERWVTVRTPHLVLAVAPASGDAPPPSDLRADLLILGRPVDPEFLTPGFLAATGAQLVLAPHPTRSVFAARPVLADGSLAAADTTHDSFAVHAGSPTVRADGVTFQVRVPS